MNLHTYIYIYIYRNPTCRRDEKPKATWKSSLKKEKHK